jgi:hypothetical protein
VRQVHDELGPDYEVRHSRMPNDPGSMTSKLRLGSRRLDQLSSDDGLRALAELLQLIE